MDESLKGRRILVCVSASIAAYKAVFLVRELTKRGAFVSVALTPSATRFVGAATFSAMASEPAYDDLWDNRGSISHTILGKSADLVVVVPATASTIAKMANGIADDIVSASLLCVDSSTPVMIAPAMHEEMWEHSATQSNLEKLIERGVQCIGPINGALAGNDIGSGRLEDPEVILETIIQKLENLPVREKTNVEVAKQSMTNPKKLVVLVTAGGTREPIDPVRVITNRSSGKMGHSLASAANAMGYETILITTSSLKSQEAIERIDVETAQEMTMAVLKYLDRADIVVMTAAVADVTPLEPSTSKLKREKGINSIEVVPTTDIVAEIVKNKNAETFVVCFAAETENIIENASKKFDQKGVDMLVANDVLAKNAGFSSDTNKVWVFSPNEEVLELGLMSKDELAFELMDLVALKSSS